jgi:Tol biopolymer transport system component
MTNYNSKIIAVFLLFCLFLPALTFSQQSKPQFRIGISRASSIYSSKERFEFSLNGTQTITINPENQITYFPEKLDSGQHYQITQLSGPRDANLLDPVSGVITADLALMANFGHPPLTIFRISFTGIEPGEQFTFTTDYGRTFYPTFNANINLGGYPRGDEYHIIQTGGPRQCILTNATGIVPDSPLLVLADCHKPAVVLFPPGDTAELLTRNTENSQRYTYYESWTPVIGGRGGDEGRYVAFTMYGKGADGSSGNYRQVFWRDRKLGVTKLVSKNAEGVEGNGNCFVPSISFDGQTVVFESVASNLYAQDNNGLRDVFVWNASTGVVKPVSLTASGKTGNGESYEPVISGDGKVIAYTSAASDIVPLEPVFNTPNVLVNYILSQITVNISKDYETGKATSGYAPTISADGKRIAFCSFSSHLVENDKNNLWDIFLYTYGAQKLKKISVTSSGGDRNQGEESSSRVVWSSISGNGEYIVYSTSADNLVPDDRNKMQDIFMYTVATGEVKRISVAPGGTEGDGASPFDQGDRIAISYDGSWIAYNTAAGNLGVPKGNIILQQTKTGQIIPVTKSIYGSTARPYLSYSGQYLAAGCGFPSDPRVSSSGLFIFYMGDPEKKVKY